MEWQHFDPLRPPPFVPHRYSRPPGVTDRVEHCRIGTDDEPPAGVAWRLVPTYRAEVGEPLVARERSRTAADIMEEYDCGNIVYDTRPVAVLAPGGALAGVALTGDGRPGSQRRWIR